MKHIYKFSLGFCISLFLSFSLMAQTTYVKMDATGAGDGTTWADAFTDLQSALDATTSGEIWIAAGTYNPTDLEKDTFNTFTISQAVALYGGFAGDESSKEDRIDGENTTTLSGDLMGNDIDNDFSQNKEDNVFHVITILAESTAVIGLDGLTISGGNTSSSNVNTDYSWRGGGIYSNNTVDINNCNFNNNFGRSGGGIYINSSLGGGHGSIINDCVFEKNSTSSQSAGVFISEINDVTISNCTFQNNLTNRGALYPIFCQNILIEDCDFKNNIATDNGNFGGGMFIWNSKGTIRGCTFENNTTGNGAGIHLDGREEMLQDPTNMIIEGCTFRGNSCLGFGGGALRTFSASYTLRGCTFESNNAPNGGAIFSSGDGQNIVQTNNTFTGHTADFGACQANYGTASNYSISHNTYTGNAANTSGGALINGFGSNVMVDSCDFDLNIASFGGAMYCQNDTTTVSISNSTFTENSVADGSGGAINIGGPVMVTIDNSLFESNIGGFGGAINANQFDDVEFIEGFVNISNSTFRLNTASSQGAGISIIDLDLNMTNTVIATNFNTGEGSGGGLSLNTTSGKSSTFNITNTTFADNFALIGGGIGAYTEDETSECIINLQNNIFDNEGLNYEIEEGNPVVNSLGGNISTDVTLESILTGPGDVTSSSNINFVDAANYDFQLRNDSPAINIGVGDGAPETDILGNPRVGAPDAGAYENQDVVGIEVIENYGQLKMIPNPAVSATSLILDNSWLGPVQISITDITGKQHLSTTVQKGTQLLEYRMNVEDFDSGNYILTVQFDQQKTSTPFIKI